MFTGRFVTDNEVKGGFAKRTAMWLATEAWLAEERRAGVLRIEISLAAVPTSSTSPAEAV